MDEQNQPQSQPTQPTKPKSSKSKYIVVIVVFLLILAGLGAYVFGVVENSEQQQVAISPTPVQPSPSVETTANWEIHSFQDEGGFGYQLSIPREWTNVAWASESSQNFGPTQLLQNFYSNDRCLRLYVLHFTSENPADEIASNVTNNETMEAISNKNAIQITKYSNKSNTKYVAYIVSTKGYYEIHGEEMCPAVDEKIFDQILSTFRFIDSQTIDTKNWNTFTDNRMTFKYPSGWKVSQNIDRITISPNNEATALFQIYVRPDKDSLDLKKEFEVEQYGKIEAKRDVQLGAALGTEYKGCFGVEGCIDSYEIIADTEENRYQITYRVDLQPDLTYYNGVISSLKFMQ